jgi:hypothetical protein
LHPEDLLWWAKGGVLRGKSAPRIAFLRQILEAGPKEGLTPLSDQWHDWNKLAGKAGEYYLLYFGVHAPTRYTFLKLQEGVKFKLDIIDTWEMTITPIEGVFEGNCEFDLPGKSYIAVRAQKI